MVEIGKHIEGHFLNAAVVKRMQEEGQSMLAQIISEPRLVETPFKKKNRAGIVETVNRVEAVVRVADGTELTYGMNDTSAGKLAGAWGTETSAWVGKTIKLEVVKMSISGEMKDVVFATPVEGGNAPAAPRPPATPAPAPAVKESEVVEVKIVKPLPEGVGGYMNGQMVKGSFFEVGKTYTLPKKYAESFVDFGFAVRNSTVQLEMSKFS